MRANRFLFPLLIAAASLAATVSPASAAPAPAPGTRVLVIPFSGLNVSADKQWITKSVQETLVANFGQTTAWSPVAFSGQLVVEDNATAARLAREATTPYAIRGSTHMVNGDIRITGQLIDAKTGDTLATGIVTGKVDDLLKLEDELAQQLRAGPAPATIATAPIPAGTGYVPRSPAAIGYTTGPAVQNANLLQPLNATTYNAPVYNTEIQESGVPAYYYSPVYTPYISYYDPGYSYIYYPPYPLYGYRNPFCNFSTNLRNFPFHHQGKFQHANFHGRWNGNWRGSWGGGGFNHYPSNIPFSTNLRFTSGSCGSFFGGSFRSAGLNVGFSSGRGHR